MQQLKERRDKLAEVIPKTEEPVQKQGWKNRLFRRKIVDAEKDTSDNTAVELSMQPKDEDCDWWTKYYASFEVIYANVNAK